MKINNFQKITLNEQNLRAYLTRLNIFENKDLILPHEDTIDDNKITKEVLNNTVIVLGVKFLSIKSEIIIEKNIFILDGHHRFKFIVDNKIDETFKVVLIDLHGVNIDSYNCELNVDLRIFINKIQSDYGFNEDNNSEYTIKVNHKEYHSESFSNIYDLYEYKKNLMLDGIISPIANNKVTQNTIVNFTPIKSDDLSDSYVFPYKSTWITPRFDS